MKDKRLPDDLEEAGRGVDAFVYIGKPATVHFRRRRNLIRRDKRFPTSAILFILQAIPKSTFYSTGHVLARNSFGRSAGPHAAPPRRAALAGYSTGETTMLPENSDSSDEFEIALHEAWEVLRGRARASNDVVHSAKTSKEHNSQDHPDSDESDVQSPAAG